GLIDPDRDAVRMAAGGVHKVRREVHHGDLPPSPTDGRAPWVAHLTDTHGSFPATPNGTPPARHAFCAVEVARRVAAAPGFRDSVPGAGSGHGAVTWRL